MKPPKRILLYLLIIVIYAVATFAANMIAKETGLRRDGMQSLSIMLLIINIIIAFILIKKHPLANIGLGMGVFIIEAFLTPILAKPPLDYHDNNHYSTLRMIIWGAIITIILWETLYLILNKTERKI